MIYIKLQDGVMIFKCFLCTPRIVVSHHSFCFVDNITDLFLGMPPPCGMQVQFNPFRLAIVPVPTSRLSVKLVRNGLNFP